MFISTLITHDKVEATGLVDVIDLRIYDGDDYTNEINSSVSNNEYVFVEIGPSSKVDAYNVTVSLFLNMLNRNGMF